MKVLVSTTPTESKASLSVGLLSYSVMGQMPLNGSSELFSATIKQLKNEKGPQEKYVKKLLTELKIVEGIRSSGNRDITEQDLNSVDGWKWFEEHTSAMQRNYNQGEEPDWLVLPPKDLAKWYTVVDLRGKRRDRTVRYLSEHWGLDQNEANTLSWGMYCTQLASVSVASITAAKLYPDDKAMFERFKAYLTPTLRQAPSGRCSESRSIAQIWPEQKEAVDLLEWFADTKEEHSIFTHAWLSLNVLLSSESGPALSEELRDQLTSLRDWLKVMKYRGLDGGLQWSELKEAVGAEGSGRESIEAIMTKFGAEVKKRKIQSLENPASLVSLLLKTWKSESKPESLQHWELLFPSLLISSQPKSDEAPELLLKMLERINNFFEHATPRYVLHLIPSEFYQAIQLFCDANIESTASEGVTAN